MSVLPSSELAPVVEFFWLTEPSPTGCFEVIPDGRLDLALVASPGRPRFEVYGPATTRQRMQLEPGVRYAGVRLRAGYGATLLRDDAWRHTDQILEHARLCGLRAEDEAARAEPARLQPGDLERLLAPIARDVARRASPKAVAAHRASQRLAAASGALRIDALAAELGSSRRTLERVFQSEVGLSPKAFARIERLSAIAERLRRTRTSWARLAAELGYSDQAHLTREVVELSGYTPRRFAERVREMPFGWV